MRPEREIEADCNSPHDDAARCGSDPPARSILCSQRAVRTLSLLKFGVHGLKERLLLDLEKVILEMISAARANDLPRLHERGRAQMAILSTIEQESTWSKERIAKYLSSN